MWIHTPWLANDDESHPSSRMLAWIELDEWQSALGLVRDSNAAFADDAAPVVWLPAELDIDTAGLPLLAGAGGARDSGAVPVLISPTACRGAGPPPWIAANAPPRVKRSTQHWTDFGGACIKAGASSRSFAPRASLDLLFSHPNEARRPEWSGPSATLRWSDSGDLLLELETPEDVVGDIRRLSRSSGLEFESMTPVTGTQTVLLPPEDLFVRPDSMGKPEAVHDALDWLARKDRDEVVEIWVDRPGPTLRLTGEQGFQAQVVASSVTLLVVPPRAHERGHWRWIQAPPAEAADDAADDGERGAAILAAMRVAGIDECLFTLPGLSALPRYRAKVSFWQGTRGRVARASGNIPAGLRACIEQAAAGVELGLELTERVDLDLSVQRVATAP